MDSHEVLKRLKRQGCLEVAQKGRHKHLKHPSGGGRVTVPHPKRDIPVGTLRSIWRQAGWNWPPE
ncbi:type II toxin-antitoxin system HicA family toxin [Rhizobium sp. SAFR-030]|uniref:type II toxin-antitoxin system HicA family toxin n=1 Tax=Rhizobium sp. SAFR-030 TaxID=3387277 RepID=UPI003F81437D